MYGYWWKGSAIFLRIFINEPELRIKIDTDRISEFETMEQFFEYIRERMKEELTSPKNWRVPATEIKKFATMYDRAKERSKNAV